LLMNRQSGLPRPYATFDQQPQDRV